MVGVLFAGSCEPQMFYLFTKYLLSPWDRCGVGVGKRHSPHRAYIFFKGKIENKQMIISTNTHFGIVKRIVRTLRIFSIRFHLLPFFFQRLAGGKGKGLTEYI